MVIDWPTLEAVKGLFGMTTLIAVALVIVYARPSPIRSTSSTMKLWLTMRWESADAHRRVIASFHDSTERMIVSDFAVVPEAITKLPPVWFTV